MLLSASGLTSSVFSVRQSSGDVTRRSKTATASTTADVYERGGTIATAAYADDSTTNCIALVDVDVSIFNATASAAPSTPSTSTSHAVFYAGRNEWLNFVCGEPARWGASFLPLAFIFANNRNNIQFNMKITSGYICCGYICCKVFTDPKCLVAQKIKGWSSIIFHSSFISSFL